MMKRIAAITLALVVPLAIVAVPVILLYEPGLPAPGRQALDFYIRYTNVNSEGAARIQQIAQANNPRAFVAELDAASFGDGSYFSVSHDINAANYDGTGGRPPPFPPLELWCVSINTSPDTRRIVFVALHEDLYKSVWIVHELRSDLSDEAVGELLQQVGCKLGQ